MRVPFVRTLLGAAVVAFASALPSPSAVHAFQADPPPELKDLA
jgi:hypothetical protein